MFKFYIILNYIIKNNYDILLCFEVVLNVVEEVLLYISLFFLLVKSSSSISIEIFLFDLKMLVFVLTFLISFPFLI